jgi:tetratricopeptide (TPR) repeat protein
MMHPRRGSCAFALLCSVWLWRAPETIAQPAATSGDASAPPKASVAKPNADKAASDKPAVADKAADKANVSKPSPDKPAADKAATKPAAEKPTGETPAGASALAAATANVEKARQHFQRGIESYRDGDLATALIEFKRAYSTAPNFRLLYNLGQVSADLRDYPAAERYLSQYLEESRNSLDEARKQAVQEELAKVRARIAYVHLTSNVEGAEVLVDDVLVGRTPLQTPVHVSTGRRRITGRAPGHAPVTQIVDAAGGEDVPVTLHLQPIPSTLAERPVVTPPVYRRGGTRKPLLLGLAIGAGVLAAGGAVFGYLAESDAVEYREALQRKTSSSELKELADGAKTYALVTDFLLGAALLTATVGTVVLLSPDIETRDQAKATQLKVGLGRIELSKHF